MVVAFTPELGLAAQAVNKNELWLYTTNTEEENDDGVSVHLADRRSTLASEEAHLPQMMWSSLFPFVPNSTIRSLGDLVITCFEPVYNG